MVAQFLVKRVCLDCSLDRKVLEGLVDGLESFRWIVQEVVVRDRKDLKTRNAGKHGFVVCAPKMNAYRFVQAIPFG